MRTPLVALLPILGLPGALPGQARTAAATITETDIRRRVNLIAHDSMGGRDTPSRGLEATARYVEREFRRMGLAPAGDSGGYRQLYGIRLREIDSAGSWIAFSDESAERIRLPFGTGTKPMFGAPREAHVAGRFVLLGGPVTLSTKVDRAALEGKGIVWVAGGSRPPNFVAVVSLATRTKAPFVIALVEHDSVYAAMPSPRGEVVSAEAVGWPVVFAAKQSAVVSQYLEAQAQIDAARQADSVTVIEIPGWTATVHTTFPRDDRLMVPNVVGTVKGTDPSLADEYVVVTAHMDHVGSRCRGADGPDKICNGADDNASGTTGLLELAEAFAHRAARPKRSLIFAAVSGEERGLWGSQYLAEHPPVPLDRIVANVNMDHLGRNWRDSIAVIGTEHSDLGLAVARMHQAHPELRMTPIPDQWPNEQIYFRSDHYNFARLGVPVLFFTNGFHPDYHAVTDSPDRVDAEKQSRVVRFIFHVLLEVANAPERPQWKPESRELIADGQADRRSDGR